MMVPRLYGLVDLSSVLDVRAYQQAQLILSEMGDNLQKLVVTDAHRKSVRAVSEFNLVLLLGARRLGTTLFTESLTETAEGVADFFERPKEFLKQTIENLSPVCKAAIALIFLNGGKVRSPVQTALKRRPSVS